MERTMGTEDKTGIISNIQRFSLDDGPGIRTTVFMQGCNLRCAWCHNPETQPTEPVLMYEEKLCIGCGSCMTACPDGVHLVDGKSHIILRDICEACGRCVSACPGKALSISGKRYTVAELMDILLRDQSFYETSGGGVTFSGGEPLLQADFVKECLIYLKESGINTAVDTAGAVDTASIGKVARYTDIFLYDLKVMDPEKHGRFVGGTNDRILYNLKKIAENGIRYYIRIPLIDGVNCDDRDIEEIIGFIRSLKRRPYRIDLLPYHTYGEGKYKSLSADPPSYLKRPDEDRLTAIRAAFSKAGFNTGLQ